LTTSSQPGGQAPRRRLAANTAIFSFFTALSRVAGLIREAVAAYLFGTSKARAAFTIASQIPNLMANLFAQAALSAAFVPVFTDLLQQGKKREAFKLASSLFWIILLALGAITVVGVGLSAVILPLFTGTNFDGSLAATLTEIMFPVVLFLGLTGMLVGVLQSYDEFSIPALAPVIWNGVIILLLLLLRPDFKHPVQVEAYAVAWLLATIVQFFLIVWALGRIDFRLTMEIDWHDPRIRQVFTLMLPVTLGLGIVNLDGLINTGFGALVNTTPRHGEGPAAIQYAFLLYMMPQGVFSVAVSTVLFPTLSRQAARRDAKGMRHTLANGMRQILLLLIPAAVGLLLLAEPITRLVFARGSFNAESIRLTSEALRWFAISLPFSGVNLLMTRTFFALQRPWIPTKLAIVNMTVDVIVSIALYKPFGIAGLVIGTASANMVMTYLQYQRLKVGFNGRLEGSQTLMIAARITVAALVMGAIARLSWAAANSAVGHSTLRISDVALPIGQIISVGLAVGLAGTFYAWAVTRMRIPEAEQIESMLRRRLSPG
jgi:putative peptidoglycan lipid II flippase